MASKPHHAATARSRTLFRDDELSICLSLYAPGAWQAAHSHELPSVSLLLAGAVGERAGASDVVAESGSLGIKPDGLRHSNVYGPEGAILLSVTVHSHDLWNMSSGGWAWNDNCHELARSSAAAIRNDVHYSDLAAELLSFRTTGDAGRAAPEWLWQARRRLARQPDVPLQELAARSGVHRVHLCRSFRRWYGESLSAFRLRRRAEIALAGYAHGGMPAAAAAFDAGFADQSHFARTIKRLTGLRPGELRGVGREVT